MFGKNDEDVRRLSSVNDEESAEETGKLTDNTSMKNEFGMGVASLSKVDLPRWNALSPASLFRLRFQPTLTLL